MLRQLTTLTDLARTYRLLMLLCALIVFLVFAAFADLAGLGRRVFNLSLLVVLIVAINAAREEVKFHRVLLVIGSLAVVFRLAPVIIDENLVHRFADIFGVILLVLTTIDVLGRIMRVETSDFDTLCGAAAVYLLLGICWAMTYDLLEVYFPGSIEPLSADEVSRWNELFYFSFTTLTTLGYGDINPVNPLARIWSTLEAATGTLYVAILIARVVSLYRNNPVD